MNIDWVSLEAMVMARVSVFRASEEGLCKLRVSGEEDLELVVGHLIAFVASIRLPAPSERDGFIVDAENGRVICVSYEPQGTGCGRGADCDGDARVSSACNVCARFKATVYS